MSLQGSALSAPVVFFGSSMLRRPAEGSCHLGSAPRVPGPAVSTADSGISIETIQTLVLAQFLGPAEGHISAFLRQGWDLNLYFAPPLLGALCL